MESDLALGEAGEVSLLKTIQMNFGLTLKPTGHYDRFDYSNGTTLVELKTRRCLSTTYPDTMVPYSKIKFLREKAKHKQAFFVFYFQDGVFYHEFNRDTKYRVKQTGRCDRGKPEYNQYCFISKEDLLQISIVL